MKIIDIDGFTAVCEARGVRRAANLFLLQHENLQPGDHVVVHLGQAVGTMTAEAARTAWDLYDDMLAIEDRRSAEFRNDEITPRRARHAEAD